jgi:UDP-GlcNAc:undecaprenyl-phosphate/decaprenyl-phosphate GlcNAc-1-phosphate transferase
MNPDLLFAYIQQQLADAVFQQGLYYVIMAFLVACFVAVVSVPVVIKITELKALMEKPGERRSHSVPTPTFGGVAIFAAVLISYFIWPLNEDPSDLYCGRGHSVLYRDEG